jgi:hypothetical protein
MFKKEDFIDGDLFENIAKELNIIYTPTDKLKEVINNQFILAHNSDGCILEKNKRIRPMNLLKPRMVDFFWDNIPSTLKILFSQNADIRDERIVPLPIGLERERWFPQLRKKDVLMETMQKQISKNKLVYLNVNPDTNINSRPLLYQLFSNNNWCTVECCRNGDSFENFVNKIKSHKFVFCPDGNGMDTHRTWETLYIGSYPIVERHYFTEEFSKHVPILIVDNWAEITEEFLNNKYKEFQNKEWNWNLLKAEYWQTLIKEKIRG